MGLRPAGSTAPYTDQRQEVGEEQRGWIQSPGLPRLTACVSASTAKHPKAEAAHQRFFPRAGKNTVSIPGVCSGLGNIQLFFILRIKESTFQAAVTPECLSEQDPMCTRPSSRPAAATRAQRLPNTATSFCAGPDQITHASPLLTLQMQQIKENTSSHLTQSEERPQSLVEPSVRTLETPTKSHSPEGPVTPCPGTDSEDHLIRHIATLVPGQALQFHSQAAKPLTPPQ